MTYYLNFEINGLPKMPNQLLGAHWRVRSEHAKRWHHHVQVATLGKIPPEPLKNAALVCVRHSSVHPDYDNLALSFKPILDGLVKVGILLDDKPSVIGIPKYFWQKASPRGGKVTITIESKTENIKEGSNV